MTARRVAMALAGSVALIAVAAPVAAPVGAAPTTSPIPAPAVSTALSITACPALYAFGVQGIGESSPDAAPTTDTGMLSLVMRAMMAAAPERGLVDRAYVPYPAGFGGAVGASVTPYTESVATGVLRLESMIRQVHAVCPRTRIAIVGYSQGAHVASITAQDIGAGTGVVAPEVVAAVVLMADPTRTPGAGLFPGTGASAPAPAPGTTGAHLARLPAAPIRSVASGGGIGPTRDLAADYGAVTGRVANLCVAGDLACDTPAGSAILRAAAGVASQSLLSTGDPIASLVSIGQALAFTSIKAATTAVEEDVSGTSLADVSVSPSKSISQRLAEASDPRTPPDMNAALTAAIRVGTIGLTAVNTAIASVLNPATLAQLASVVLSNPVAAVALLGEKFTTTVNDLIPPITGDRLVTAAFDVVQREVADNQALLDLAMWVRLWETGMRHDAYSHALGEGPSPAAWAGAWLAAAAHDAATSPPVTGRATTETARPPATTLMPGSPTTSTIRSVDLPAPTTSPSLSPVEVVGAPQLAAAPSLPIDPSTGPASTVAGVGPRQPGISLDTTAPSSPTVVRQPGITTDTGR
ncbi:cutinase family protein [Nocardia sp. NPDC087230]|uniref:cutinase family protein n=1 Tax=Nocardia sp. NPDC087230 TaxID=3364331 RepID=UPI00382C282F